MLPGDSVRVREWKEVRATLDACGMLDDLPFMEEMAAFCGGTFTVSKRLERTCEEASGEMRRIRSVVYLDDLRCDGSGHGGCSKRCSLFWKEAWLERVSHAGSPSVCVNREHVAFPYAHASSDGRYVCQSTELMHATTPLPWWDVCMVVRDVRAGTYSLPGLLGIIASAFIKRLVCAATGRSYRHLEGTCTRTPSSALNLQPGEWVTVKPKQTITGTLDAAGKNRGLAFTVEMLPFCGGRYRVLARVDRMIHEPTGKLVDVQDTVILEDVICDGCHILRGGCPRANYHYWREVWLERVPDDTPGGARREEARP